MAKMVVVFEWDEENLAKGWMNIGNLGLLLYGVDNTRPDLLKATEVTEYIEEVISNLDMPEQTKQELLTYARKALEHLVRDE